MKKIKKHNSQIWNEKEGNVLTQLRRIRFISPYIINNEWNINWILGIIITISFDNKKIWKRNNKL